MPKAQTNVIDIEARSYWYPSVVVICITQFLVMAGMNIVVPFIPFFVRELGVTDPASVQRWSGLIIAGPFMTAVLANPIWGALGDRVGRKLMINRALIGLAIVLFLMGLVETPGQLFIVRLLQGVLSGFIAAATALIATLVPEKKMSWGMGVLTASQAAGVLVGPFFGGLVADTIGFRPLFFAVSIVMLLGLPAVVIYVRETKQDGVKPGFMIGLKIVQASKKIQQALIALGIGRTAVFLVFPIFPLFLETMVKSHVATWTGALMGISGFFSMLSAPILGRMGDKKGINRIMPYLLAGTSITLALHYFATSAYQLIAVRALHGIFIGGIFPLVFSYIGLQVIPKNRGATLGVAHSAFMLGHLVGPLLGGYLAPIIGMRPIFLISSLVILLAYVPFYFSSKKDTIILGEIC
jgi:MFS transporter, DHA1 family, multidrug resistance protein